MPTAVEYSPEGENHLPAVQQGTGIQGFAGGVKPLAVWGLFLGGVFVVIIAVLFGPAGFAGGLLKPLMGDEAWASMTCASVPAVQKGGDESSLPAVQSDGGESSLPAVQKGDGGVAVDPNNPNTPGPDDLVVSFAMWLNDTRMGLGADGFLPPNPCFVPMSGEPDPLNDPPGTEIPIPQDNPPHKADSNSCVPITNDGVCSECENTDIDSASCVCIINGVCDPQEGFNCPDCQPTPIPAAEEDEIERPGGGQQERADKPTCTPGKPC